MSLLRRSRPRSHCGRKSSRRRASSWSSTFLHARSHLDHGDRMSNELRVHEDRTILRVTINRPADGNGMSDDMAQELTDVLDRAHETAEMVLLRGAGADFCTGRAPRADARQPSPEAYA